MPNTKPNRKLNGKPNSEPNSEPNSKSFIQRFCNHKFSVLLALISLTISGCSSLGSESAADTDKVYTGWYCEGQINSDDNWHCSEGPLKAGVPISTAESQTAVNNAREQAPEQATEKAPEKALVQVPEKQAERVIDNNMIPEEAAAELIAEPVKEPVKEPAIFDISGSGYTVQLGAYLSQAKAEEAADKIILIQGELRVRDIVVDDRYMFVVVFGQYATRQQATAAAEQLNEINPGLGFWVRTIASMRARN